MKRTRKETAQGIVAAAELLLDAIKKTHALGGAVARVEEKEKMMDEIIDAIQDPEAILEFMSRVESLAGLMQGLITVRMLKEAMAKGDISVMVVGGDNLDDLLSALTKPDPNVS